MEPCAHLQQAGHSSANLYPTLAGVGDVAEHFEQGALAGPVPADDAHGVALLDLQVQVAERPQDLGLVGHGGTWMHQALDRSLGCRHDGVPERRVHVPHGADAVAFAQVYCSKGKFCHVLDHIREHPFHALEEEESAHQQNEHYGQ